MVSRRINKLVSMHDHGSHLGIQVHTTAATLNTAEAVLMLTEITDWLTGNGWRQVDGGWERRVGATAQS